MVGLLKWTELFPVFGFKQIMEPQSSSSFLTEIGLLLLHNSLQTQNRKKLRLVHYIKAIMAYWMRLVSFDSVIATQELGLVRSSGLPVPSQ